MSDKILKEAYDKIVSIEEDSRDDYDEDDRSIKCPHCGTINDRDDMRGHTNCENCGKDVYADTVEEAQSPEEEQINVLTMRMRRATEDDDEAAYKRAVTQLNALTDKMNSEQPVEEGEVSTSTNEYLHAAAIEMLDDMLDNSAIDQYGEKGDVLRYAIKRLQEVGLGR